MEFPVLGSCLYPIKNIWLGWCALGSFMALWRQPEAPYTNIWRIPLSCKCYSAFRLQVRVMSRQYTLQTPEGLWRCIGLENTFPVFLPYRGFSVFGILQHHRLSHNRVVRLFKIASHWCEAKRSQNKCMSGIVILLVSM